MCVCIRETLCVFILEKWRDWFCMRENIAQYCSGLVLYFDDSDNHMRQCQVNIVCRVSFPIQTALVFEMPSSLYVTEYYTDGGTRFVVKPKILDFQW